MKIKNGPKKIFDKLSARIYITSATYFEDKFRIDAICSLLGLKPS